MNTFNLSIKFLWWRTNFDKNSQKATYRKGPQPTTWSYAINRCLNSQMRHVNMWFPRTWYSLSASGLRRFIHCMYFIVQEHQAPLKGCLFERTHGTATCVCVGCNYSVLGVGSYAIHTYSCVNFQIKHLRLHVWRYSRTVEWAGLQSKPPNPCLFKHFQIFSAEYAKIGQKYGVNGSDVNIAIRVVCHMFV